LHGSEHGQAFFVGVGVEEGYVFFGSALALEVYWEQVGAAGE
jgi:hypothetical protein